jgi:hypothetical protein
MTRDGSCNCEPDTVSFLVTPAAKSKLRSTRGSSSPRGCPSFLCGGRLAGDAIAPMCDQGFGPTMGALPPPARVESGKENPVKGAERRRR